MENHDSQHSHGRFQLTPFSHISGSGSKFVCEQYLKKTPFVGQYIPCEHIIVQSIITKYILVNTTKNRRIQYILVLLASSPQDFRALRFSRQCASSLNITNDTNAGVVHIFYLLATTCYNYSNQLSVSMFISTRKARLEQNHRTVYMIMFTNAQRTAPSLAKESGILCNFWFHRTPESPKHLLSSELSKISGVPASLHLIFKQQSPQDPHIGCCSLCCCLTGHFIW